MSTSIRRKLETNANELETNANELETNANELETNANELETNEPESLLEGESRSQKSRNSTWEMGISSGSDVKF